MGEETLPVFVFGCMVCGKTVAGTEVSCPRCGASFEDVKFECPFCGELASPTQRRCSVCGTEFGALQRRSPRPRPLIWTVLSTFHTETRSRTRIAVSKKWNTSVRAVANRSPRATRSALTVVLFSRRTAWEKLLWGRDRELNPGQGIHSPQGYHYPTPAIDIPPYPFRR